MWNSSSEALYSSQGLQQFFLSRDPDVSDLVRGTYTSIVSRMSLPPFYLSDIFALPIVLVVCQPLLAKQTVLINLTAGVLVS